MSFGIESPSWFEPSLTFQVLLFSLFSFATYAFGMLARFPGRALRFCLCSQLLFVWNVLLTCFTGQNAMLFIL